MSGTDTEQDGIGPDLSCSGGLPEGRAGIGLCRLLAANGGGNRENEVKIACADYPSLVDDGNALKLQN